MAFYLINYRAFCWLRLHYMMMWLNPHSAFDGYTRSALQKKEAKKKTVRLLVVLYIQFYPSLPEILNIKCAVNYGG